MAKYRHQEIERRWQEEWERRDAFVAKDAPSPSPLDGARGTSPRAGEENNVYVLDMFPYPSSDGLHVGHPEGYTASDIVTRYLRMKGKNVLHPMGWDAFGLPAENAAIKKGVHPRIVTEQNIKNFKRQIQSLGFSYDWSREVNTTDPGYYKWTQWIFLQLYKRGLAYEAELPIWWCPKDKTGLANEEVVNGCCERCGTKVERKLIRQWLLKITAYAERLISGLVDLEWPESIKTLQRNWIGKSVGAEVKFVVQTDAKNANVRESTNKEVWVFTTRPDTLFGATYLVLSPENPLVDSITTIEQKKAIDKYKKEVAAKSDLERTALEKEKTGVFTGAYAVNPANNEKIPVWIADYVLMSYGTGAIMAVPAHDERDFTFAKKNRLPIPTVIQPLTAQECWYFGIEPTFGLSDNEMKIYQQRKAKKILFENEGQGAEPKHKAFVGEGVMVNSGRFTGTSSQNGRNKIVEWLAKEGKAKATVQYKLRDWVFSRQRYWGEPIPLVHCPKDGVVPVLEEDLPVLLPDVEKYEPTGTGESPLAGIKEWVNVKCPRCGQPAKRETNTMPQWAGSCWYYLRYLDPKNDKVLAGVEKMKAWLPVDLYVGGAEHAVLHLLYARFWHMVLFDAGVIPKECGDEPFIKLNNQGLILGEDGEKMSKSRGNVINPDPLIEKYGADSFRMYEMFMGPFEDAKPWDTNGIVGVKRFLERVWLIGEKLIGKKLIGELEDETTGEMPNRAHTYVKSISTGIENFRFNTCVSDLMKWSNEWKQGVGRGEFETFLKLLSPFAPHVAEELWSKLGHTILLVQEKWPTYDPKKVTSENVTIAVQVNGKLRGTVSVNSGAEQKEVEMLAKAEPNVKKYLTSEPKKVIFVKDRLINFVV